MMHRRKKNNKAALFLVLLILVGYIFINLGQNVNSESENKANYEKEVVNQPEECTTCGPTLEEEIVYEETQMNVVMIDEEYTVDILDENGEVAALFSFLKKGDCSELSDDTLNSLYRACGTNTVDLVYEKQTLLTLLGSLTTVGGSVSVDSITNFKLTMATYPLAYFLGQYVVQNSNRQASMESPNYSSSGQAMDENYTLKTQIPDPELMEELRYTFEEKRREPFFVKALLDILNRGAGSGGADEDESEVFVSNTDDDPISPCPEETTKSDYNPISSNVQATVGGGYTRQHIPDEEIIIIQEEKVPVDQIQCLPLESNIKMVNRGVVLSCLDIYAIATGLISSVFSTTQIANCTAPDTCPPITSVPAANCGATGGRWDQSAGVCVCPGGTTSQSNGVCPGGGCSSPDPCVDLKELAVKMTPIFGEPNECTDQLCANAYLADVYRAGLTPNQSKGTKVSSSNMEEESLMFFIGTPCRGELTLVAGGRSKKVPIEVTCLWDASPLLLDYQIQAMYRSPNEEDFPSSFSIYWNLVQQAVGLSSDYYDL